MRIGKVIGTVTLNRSHPSLAAARYRIVVPLSLDNLTGQTPADAEGLVVYDDMGAGMGDLIAFSEGGEAAQPFHPHPKPVDAYCAALLDDVQIENPHAGS
jgi:microcompartment protein CcmK/EutM